MGRLPMPLTPVPPFRITQAAMPPALATSSGDIGAIEQEIYRMFDLEVPVRPNEFECYDLDKLRVTTSDKANEPEQPKRRLFLKDEDHD